MSTRSSALLALALSLLPTPSMADVVALEPLWEVGRDEAEVFFGVISDLDVDDEGNVFIVDRQLTEVTMFTTDGVLVGQIGREGEGPGEFSRIGSAFVAGPDEIAVLQRMPGKVVGVRHDGTAGRSYEMPPVFRDSPAYFYRGRRAGNDLVIAARVLIRDGDALASTTLLTRIDGSGNEVARLSEHATEASLGNFEIEERSDIAPLWAVDDEGRVVVNDVFEGYRVRIHAADGSVVREITREYVPRERSSREMERNTPRMTVMTQDGRRVDARGVASRTDRDVQGVYARPNGRLWVLTSRGAFDQENGILATFDEFDGDGTWTRQVSLQGPGSFVDDDFHFAGDRIFVLRGMRAALRASRGVGDDGDDEPMSVACYRIPE